MYIPYFKTNGYKLITDSGNIIYSILNHKLKRVVSNLRLPKEQKQAKAKVQ